MKELCKLDFLQMLNLIYLSLNVVKVLHIEAKRYGAKQK